MPWSGHFIEISFSRKRERVRVREREREISSFAWRRVQKLRASKFANPIDFGVGVSLTKTATRSAVVFFSPQPPILFPSLFTSLYFNRASSTRLSTYCRTYAYSPLYLPVRKIHGESFDQGGGVLRLQLEEVCVLAIRSYEIWREAFDRQSFKDLSTEKILYLRFYISEVFYI